MFIAILFREREEIFMKLLIGTLSLFAIMLFVPLTIQAQVLPIQSEVIDFEKFQRAIDKGDVDEVKRLLADESVEPNARNRFGERPIHYAISIYSSSRFRSLLPSSQNTVHLRNLEIIRAFSENSRVDMNAQDRLGNAPLHTAGHLRVHALEVINLLFENKDIKFNIRNKHLETPFHVAAAYTEDFRVIEAYFALPKENLEVNPRDTQRRTPLLRAVKSSDNRITRPFFEDKRTNVKAVDYESKGVRWYAYNKEFVENALRERGIVGRLKSQSAKLTDILPWSKNKGESANAETLPMGKKLLDGCY